MWMTLMGFSLGRVLLPVVEADPEAGGPKVPEGGTLRGASQCSYFIPLYKNSIVISNKGLVLKLLSYVKM